jgi:ubiquinone/menaquinone biosynthesis C-methylase UbiE
MTSPVRSPILEQRRYYTETASRYDVMHAHEGVEDDSCNQILYPILRAFEIRSLLDVGSATGRGLPRIAEGLSDAWIVGVEPVEALVRQGVISGVTQGIPLFQGTGEALPFQDASFDAVCEFSTLHHVPDPAMVVKEMLRVARKVVVIVDANRFGQGSVPMRLIKLLLFKMRLWNLYYFLRTGGKRYQVSEGDGLFYSYSVYDNYDVIQQWAERIFLFPAGETRSWSWFHPLLHSSGVMLIAVRKTSAADR